MRGTLLIVCMAIALASAGVMLFGERAPRRPQALPEPLRERPGPWAQVRRSQALEGGKVVSWISLPSPQVPGDPLFDVHCLVLEAPGGVAIVCPGAEQGAFAELTRSPP